MNEKSQDSIILNYLKKDGNTITTAEAFGLFKIVDLQSVIRNLRKSENIQDEWISAKNHLGKSIRYKKYWLEKEAV